MKDNMKDDNGILNDRLVLIMEAWPCLDEKGRKKVFKEARKQAKRCVKELRKLREEGGKK